MLDKMTKKDAYAYGFPVIKLPANAIRHLTILLPRNGYNIGIYGWNWDAYIVNGVVFCTGYRNLPGSITKEERELVEAYEEAAHALCMKAYCPSIKAKISRLLEDLCTELKAGRA